MDLILFSANQSWMEWAMSSGSLSLRMNSGAPFSSTFPLGEVRYEVPAPNVGYAGWACCGKPVESPWRRSRGLGGRVPTKRIPLNLFLFTW